MKIQTIKTFFVFFFILLGGLAVSAYANVPGGGTGTGGNVTVTDNGGTVVLANGIVSFTINKTSGNITNFTYNGTNLLAGGNGGGYFYFDGSGGPTLANTVYTLTVNPTNNGGNQAEVWLQSTADPMDMAVYYDLLRGQQGIYDTMILTHQTGYADYPGAELRTNMYVGSIFDWLAVDPYRFRQMAPPSTAVTTVPGAPAEVMQYTAGIYNGLTNCKYSYSAPLGKLDVYGWASSTQPYGVWQTFPSHEYLDGGPMHRELTEHIGNTLLDMFGGGHYGFGSSQDQPAGTFSSKTFGPAFIYANKYAGSASDPVSLKARTLWADAQAQAAAEQGAWPYTWFNPQPVAGAAGSVYPQGSARGTASGTLAVNDPYNPGTSPVSIWIGLAPVDGGVDFQQQYLTSQFWVKTGAGGNFSIPNLLPGTYNLWAFGPGVVGTFEKTNVSVAAGQSLNLGTLTWAPLRLGPTVWEIGTPDRDSNEFNNGEHQSTPYSGTLPAYAGGPPYDTPAQWGAFLAYANQYPNGVSFVVGTSNPGADWNYCQPDIPNGSGGFAGSTSKIYFNLATAPTAAQTARLYIAFASVYSSACILTINGTVQTASVMGSTAGNYTAITNATTGFYPPNLSFDSIVRLGSQGTWGDAYLDFAGTKLKAGMNEIDLGLRPTGGAGNGNGFEYDYVRMELTGYSSSATPTKTNTPAASTSTFTRTATATSTSTATSTPTRTNSPTFTFTFTPSRTPTNSPTQTFTNTMSFTPTSTRTSTPTFTSTFTPSRTPTPTATNTFSSTMSATQTSTFTLTRTSTPTSTQTFTSTASRTPTPSATSTATSTTTSTNTATNSFTRTSTPTSTSTATNTATSAATSTNSPTPSSTNSPSRTSTPTPSNTATATSTLSHTPTSTGTSTSTPTATATNTNSSTPSNSPTLTHTSTASMTATSTSSPTVTSTLTLTFTGTTSPTPSSTPTPTSTASFTSTKTFTPTTTYSNTFTFTPSFTPSATASATRTPTATSTASFTSTATGTSTLTKTFTWTNTLTPTATFSPSLTPTASLTSTASATSTSTRTSTSTSTSTSTPTLSFTATASSTATATITSTASATTTPTFTPSPATGIAAVIYPNPVAGDSTQVQITGLTESTKVSLELQTVAFRKIVEVTFHSEGPGTVNLTLPLKDRTGADLANGLYYLVVRAQNNTLILKLMVLR